MEQQCVICEGQFYPEALDKNNKCSVCAKEFPTAKNRNEALKQTMPQKDQMSTLTEMRVREIVSEEIGKALSVLKEKKETNQVVAVRMKKARDARGKNKETETKKETE